MPLLRSIIVTTYFSLADTASDSRNALNGRLRVDDMAVRCFSGKMSGALAPMQLQWQFQGMQQQDLQLA